MELLQQRRGLKTCAVTLAFTLVLAPGLQIGRAQTSLLKMRYLLTATEGIVPDRAEVLAAAEVREARWSYDGTYALALREASLPTDTGQEPQSTLSLSVWYSSSRRVRTLWTEKAFQNAEGSLSWLPRSGMALAEISSRDAEGYTTKQLLWLDPSQERVRAIAFNALAELQISPTEAVALIHDSAYSESENEAENEAESKAAFRILKADGTVKAADPLPERKGNWGGEWTDGGKTFQAVNVELQKDPDRPGRVRIVRYSLQLNLQTGAWTPVPELAPKPGELAVVADNASAKNGSHLRVERGISTIQDGKPKQTIHPAWLVTDAATETPRVLLTSNCDEVTLSPAGNAVLYRTQEGAFIVPLSRVPVAEMVQRLRTIAITNAKYIGLGITQYVEDYDETYPLQEFNIATAVGPYVKNDDIFEGFVYHFPGAELAKIDKPAETILGTLPGPGGEAVLYADGHVKWRDKQ